MYESNFNFLIAPNSQHITSFSSPAWRLAAYRPPRVYFSPLSTKIIPFFRLSTSFSASVAAAALSSLSSHPLCVCVCVCMFPCSCVPVFLCVPPPLSHDPRILSISSLYCPILHPLYHIHQLRQVFSYPTQT